MKNTSFVLVKPEFANYPEVIDEIKRRFVEAGLEIVEEDYVKYDKEDGEAHYDEHKEKKFFGELVDYISSDKSYAMIVKCEDVINVIRFLVCRDKQAGLQPGDIRYDIPHVLGQELDMTKNVVHASDEPESAEREITIYRSAKAKETAPQRG
jgi:nucleoside-diphosphate kinase